MVKYICFLKAEVSKFLPKPTPPPPPHTQNLTHFPSLPEIHTDIKPDILFNILNIKGALKSSLNTMQKTPNILIILLKYPYNPL